MQTRITTGDKRQMLLIYLTCKWQHVSPLLINYLKSEFEIVVDC